MKTTKRYYRVERKDIAFIKFIFEAYDGIAVVSTISAGNGSVAVIVAPGCENEVDMVIDDLKKQMRIEKVSAKCV